MTKKDMEQFKGLLLQLRAQIRGDVRQISSSALDGGQDSKSPTHMAELGTETFEQDFSLGVMERDQGQLEQIEGALKRIDDGVYGLCESCLAQGKSPAKAMIPKTRLKAVPFARECVDCARKRERARY
jgi:DnaK suppressor protein